MRKRLAKSYLLILLGLVSALLFFPMMRNGNQPRVQVVTEVGKVDKAFIRELAPHAKRLGKAYGVRPSVLLAQASLETDYGRSLLGDKYRNLYGLPHEQGTGVTLAVAASGKAKVQSKTYQVYPTWEASLGDYLARLKAGRLGDKGLYENLVTAPTLERAAQALVDGGFREDNAYADHLLTIIREQKLDQYDK